MFVHVHVSQVSEVFILNTFFFLIYIILYSPADFYLISSLSLEATRLSDLLFIFIIFYYYSRLGFFFITFLFFPLCHFIRSELMFTP